MRPGGGKALTIYIRSKNAAGDACLQQGCHVDSGLVKLRFDSGVPDIYIYIYLRAAAPAADPGNKYGGLATFGYLLKQGNLGTNLRNISIAPCES